MMDQLLVWLTKTAPFATLAAIYIMYRVLMNVRENDLKHLDEKMDLYHEEVISRVSRLESRMDEYLDK